MPTSNQISLKLIDPSELAIQRHGLISKITSVGKKEPNTELQLIYAGLTASSDCRDFLNYYDSIEKSSVEDVSVTLPSESEKLTSKEVSEPPLSTEKQHYARLTKIPPRIAAMPAFWTSYQIEMIRAKIIEPANLAAQAGATDSGRARIEKAMKRRNVDLIDACVRTILRQLGGLPEARGNVSLFVDCKIARAWWRGYIANCVTRDMEHLELDSVWNLLRLTKAPWDAMILYGLRRLTTISDRSVRSAFVARLVEMDIQNMPSTEREAEVVLLMKKIGVISANRTLGYLTPPENLEIFRRV